MAEKDLKNNTRQGSASEVIDDSELVPALEHDTISGTHGVVDGPLAEDAETRSGGQERDQRLSPHEELVIIVDELITASHDEQEITALRTTREDLLKAMEELKSRRK